MAVQEPTNVRERLASPWVNGSVLGPIVDLSDVGEHESPEDGLDEAVTQVVVEVGSGGKHVTEQPFAAGARDGC